MKDSTIYSKKDEVEMYLNHSKFIWEKIKMNQESSDRYFNFFLLFITTPLVFFAAIISKKIEGINYDLLELLPSICLLLFFIGFFFSIAYIKFRVHKILYTRELMHIENFYLETKLYGRPLKNIINWNNKSVFSNVGGDFFLSAVQMITNAFWLTLFVYLIRAISCFYGLTVFLIVIFFFQCLIRYLILYKVEVKN